MSVWRGLMRRRVAMVGLVVAVAFVVLAAAAPVIAPYAPQEMVPGGMTADGSPLPPSEQFWFGTDVLIHLSLGTLRYLGPERATAPGVPAAAPAGRPRRGLMVYDGGVG